MKITVTYESPGIALARVMNTMQDSLGWCATHAPIFRASLVSRAKKLKKQAVKARIEAQKERKRKQQEQEEIRLKTVRDRIIAMLDRQNKHIDQAQYCVNSVVNRGFFPKTQTGWR